MQEPLLYLDDSTVFLYAGLWIASKMKPSVLTSRMEQYPCCATRKLTLHIYVHNTKFGSALR